MKIRLDLGFLDIKREISNEMGIPLFTSRKQPVSLHFLWRSLRSGLILAVFFNFFLLGP